MKCFLDIWSPNFVADNEDIEFETYVKKLIKISVINIINICTTCIRGVFGPQSLGSFSPQPQTQQCLVHCNNSYTMFATLLFVYAILSRRGLPFYERCCTNNVSDGQACKYVYKMGSWGAARSAFAVFSTAALVPRARHNSNKHANEMRLVAPTLCWTHTLAIVKVVRARVRVLLQSWGFMCVGAHTARNENPKRSIHNTQSHADQRAS